MPFNALTKVSAKSTVPSLMRRNETATIPKSARRPQSGFYLEYLNKLIAKRHAAGKPYARY